MENGLRKETILHSVEFIFGVGANIAWHTYIQEGDTVISGPSIHRAAYTTEDLAAVMPEIDATALQALAASGAEATALREQLQTVQEEAAVRSQWLNVAQQEIAARDLQLQAGQQEIARLQAQLNEATRLLAEATVAQSQEA